MSMTRLAGALVLLLALAPAGCSDDPTSTPPGARTGLTGGRIDPGAGSFEYVFETAGDPSAPIAGPFALTGTNIRYEDGALVVDLTVINQGTGIHPEPVTLTFVDLRPDSVEVLNPDNDVHGPGAAIVFGFANDDGVWTPGEASLPRTVRFDVGEGVSIAFAARIDVGVPPGGGTIAGVVWSDLNENGNRDPGEPGIADAAVLLARGDGREIIGRTRTDASGAYRFPHLVAGLYVVTLQPDNLCRPTTPATLEVILVERNAVVSDFLEADFGCAPRAEPPDIYVGAFVTVSGRYDPAVGSGLLARIVSVSNCTLTMGPIDTCPARELRGPVTAVDTLNTRIAVMGSWISLQGLADAMIPMLPIEVGDRVRVVVKREVNSRIPVAILIEPWEGDEDGLQGIVEEIFPSNGTPVYAFRVLGVYVQLTSLTSVVPEAPGG